MIVGSKRVFIYRYDGVFNLCQAICNDKFRPPMSHIRVDYFVFLFDYLSDLPSSIYLPQLDQCRR